MYQQSCFLVHGFNVKDGGHRSTESLVPLVESEGHIATQFKYGWTDLIRVYLYSEQLALRIAEQVMPNDMGIGHSNGCALLWRAANLGSKFRTLIFIAPALDSDIEFPPQVENIYVLYSSHDFPTWVAKYLPFSPWGSMGHSGYKGKDTRVRNINCSGWSQGHSDYFVGANLEMLFLTIRRLIRENATCVDYGFFI